MPTHPRDDSPEEIERKIREGRGQGEMENYKTWIYTDEVASAGNSYVVWSHKLQREVHLLSDGEYHLWLIWEYSPSIVDYWEQYPHLELDRLLKIADQHHIKYPMVPRRKNPSVKDPHIITTDFVISVIFNGNVEIRPIAFKYSKPYPGSEAVRSNTLEDRRALEKLELERLSWEMYGHKLQIMTERDVPEPVWKNLENARYNIEKLSDEQIHEIALYLTRRVTTEVRPLREITRECDRQLGYALGNGTSLGVVWHLIARHKWIIDLNTLVDTDKPLRLLSHSL